MVIRQPQPSYSGLQWPPRQINCPPLVCGHFLCISTYEPFSGNKVLNCYFLSPHYSQKMKAATSDFLEMPWSQIILYQIHLYKTGSAVKDTGSIFLLLHDKTHMWCSHHSICASLQQAFFFWIAFFWTVYCWFLMLLLQKWAALNSACDLLNPCSLPDSLKCLVW